MNEPATPYANSRRVLHAFSPNGGLFANDEGLDTLQVPDAVCALFRDLAAHDFRPAREVAEADHTWEIRSIIDVDILGHIFEQSITALERIRQDLESGTPPTTTPDARDAGMLPVPRISAFQLLPQNIRWIEPPGK